MDDYAMRDRLWRMELTLAECHSRADSIAQENHRAVVALSWAADDVPNVPLDQLAEWCRDEIKRLREENGDLRLAVGHANDHADLAIHDMEQANAEVERLRAEVGCKHECAEVEYECRRLSAEVERLRKVRDAAVCLDAYLRANGLFAGQEVLPLVDLRAALDATKEDTNV